VFSYGSLALRIRSSPIFPPPRTTLRVVGGTGNSAELVPPPWRWYRLAAVLYVSLQSEGSVALGTALRLDIYIY